MRSEVHEVSSQRERRSLPFGRYDRVLSSPKVPLILALGALLTVGLLLGAGPGPFQASAAEATTWYVDWEAAGANNGTSWTDAFVDLQLALDAATEGDQIWVAEGTYYPSVPHGGSGDRYKSFQMVNGVGIYGGFDPSTGDIGWDDRDWVHHEVVLSGDIGVQGNDSDNCYHVFSHPATLGLDNSAILDGFTVTRGNADDPGGVHTNGGGMRNVSASPTLANCAFELNKSFDNGAGIYNESSSPVITNCTFRLNRAGWDGGALFSVESSPTVEGSTFVGNSALGMGGGVANQDSSASYTDCSFVENEADYGGGGMVNWGGSATLTNCVFLANVATTYWGEGGGIQSSGSTVFVTNSTFALNQAIKGGAMHTWGGQPRITNCTFYGNVAQEGGALSNTTNASPVVVNSILWGDTPDEISGGEPIIRYSDVEGGWPGEGNIDQDPLFVDPGGDDFHLGETSPCIDVGTNDTPYMPPYDYEGDERIMDGDGDDLFVVDMGVDERLGATLEPITGLEASNDSPTPLGSITTLTAAVATGNGVSFDWDLGDYSYASGTEVTHTYGAVGVYTAIVTATNLISQQTAETTVTVEDIPIAGLEAVNDSPTLLGHTTTLTATVGAGTGISYTWALGDGEFATTRVVTHIYPAAGDLTAVVTATNSVGQQSAVTLVTITPLSYPVYLPLVLNKH